MSIFGIVLAGLGAVVVIGVVIVAVVVFNLKPGDVP